MDPFHHHPYMRPPPPPQQQHPQPPPPPPPTADPNFYHHQLPRPPPLPPQSSWYYHQPPPPPSHSPSPQHNWAPQPPPLQLQQPPPLPQPYPPPPPSHPYPSHCPPLPPRPPQPYPPVSQGWGNPNWGQQHQGLDYPVPAHNNAEDWAARARAWAAAKKVTMEDQHSQSQYPQVVQTEEQGRFHDQHFQGADSHYQDVQQQPFPAPGYQEFLVAAAPSHQLPVAYPQETASFNTGPSTYIPDEHQSFPYGGSISAGASTLSPSVHQQEVPSSYSSVTGKDDHKEQPYNTLPLPSSTAQGQHNVQLSPPVFGKSLLNDQSACGDQAAEPRSDPEDQPLDFVPSYSSHNESAGAVRGTGPATPMPSVSSWVPGVATGSLYPPIPPVLPSVPQHDPSIPLPSLVIGNATTAFGSCPSVSSFQQAISSAASYGVAAGTAFHRTTGFPGDAYGVSSVSDRPKKASVPNWLKEEIIKNASVIARSSTDHPKEEAQSFEDEGVEKSFSKGDQADSKSIDSPQSTEEEEEDEEDYAEAARTAVINQEIKRVLTEVLLKVTDELFDEIATKVLDEADPIVGVEHKAGSTDQKTSPSPLAVPTPKVSAKILVPMEAKETKDEDSSEQSISGSAGNLLGLANYVTDEDEDEDDDDDDDKVCSSSMSGCRENTGQQASILKLSEEMHAAAENDSSHMELGKSRQGLTKTSAVVGKHDLPKVVTQTNIVEISVNGGKAVDSTNGSQLDAAYGVNAIGQEISVEQLMTNNSLAMTTKMRLSEANQPEAKNNDAGKASVRETESSRADVREDVKHRRQDEKKLFKSERMEDTNGFKDRVTEQGAVKMREKLKEFESRKRTSQTNDMEDRKEEKIQRASVKGDANRNGAQTKDEEEDRARHKHTSDSNRYKRGCSPPVITRGRNSKDNDSSDEASDDSKREPISRKRHSSPLPDLSKRRHVSRSPHSKHSQRRHSPAYSSLEATRGQRSRFKSPARRQR